MQRTLRSRTTIFQLLLRHNDRCDGIPSFDSNSALHRKYILLALSLPSNIMGVPKFFRWMSERYPAISQLIAENRIPEFDCLYLDMNGIIHNCTHKDSDDATFRMTEEQMFIAIFNYIEHLFGKIKPKQLFFMAIDGVAPRAKMNQQRARRFRTALDVEVAREKAIKEGKEMPKEEAFDSNAITPGKSKSSRIRMTLTIQGLNSCTN